ncbi:hypothetical protein [Streptococcus sp. ST14]|uniref:hypothetical protein n=1 Tax=Streptococcus TaxID=1301 RepID=UPI0038D4E6DA
MSNIGMKSVIGVLLITSILLGGCSVKKDIKNSYDISSETTKENSKQEESAETTKDSSKKETENPEKTVTKYVDDKVVNAFINDYNSKSNSSLEDIKKGNIKTKYFATSYGYYLELLHANDTDKINVTINQTNENSASGVAGMKEVFRDIVKSIEPSLTDDEINSYFDKLVSNEAITDSNLASLIIKYVPDKELSYGHSRGHIKVIAQ